MNIQLEEMTMLRKAPQAWSRALSTDVTPTSRLSHSMLSMASSRVKSVDVGSSRLTHWSRGSPRVSDPLPTDVRVRDDSPPAPSAANPSRCDVPIKMPPSVMEGASGAGTNLSPSTTTPGDPSATSPSVRPAPGTVAWAADGTGRANASCNAALTPDYDPYVTATTTSTYVSGVMTGCVMSAVDSPVRPAIDSGITAITGCFVTFEGTP